MHVICTAGHVDHGKSTLVRALTGMEPDRWEEEHRRGLTIDLGFAWCSLEAPGQEPTTVAFVDLPGHQRFVANMLAGAGSVAVALLVVSADDGWMPQSQEHLEILDLLGVDRGVVAITKADLVDEEGLEFAVELTREELIGTTLEGVPIVPVSAATGQGLDDLRAALFATLDTVDRAGDGEPTRPRLWIDRCFTMRGAGTVVTGTLRGGPLSIDEEVQVLPAGVRTRVRSLQSLGRSVTTAPPGGRVAINLAGVTREEIGRGHAVVTPGQWRATSSFEAWVRVLPDRELSRRGDWHLHAGSGEWTCAVIPVTAPQVPGGTAGSVRIELEGEAVLAPGDRFVLRESGRRQTVGGGIVLDVAPGPRARGILGRAARDRELSLRLAAVSSGDRVALLAAHARQHGATPVADAPAIAGIGPTGLSTADADPRLLRLGATWVDRDQAAAWAQAVTDALGDYHATHPIERAAPKDVAIRAAETAGCPSGVAADLLAWMTTQDALAVETTGVRLPTHVVELDEATAQARQALLDTLDAAGFAPPELDAAAAAAGANQVLIRELEAAGELVRLEPNMAVTPATIERAHAVLEEAFLAEGPLTASRAKELLGTTRKYAMPLLAVLDRSGRTRRDGDVRIVRPRGVAVTPGSSGPD